MPINHNKVKNEIISITTSWKMMLELPQIMKHTNTEMYYFYRIDLAVSF